MVKENLILPDGWVSKEIGNLYNEKRKSKLKVSDAAKFGGIPFYTSGESILEHNEILTQGENIFLTTGGAANVKYFRGNVAYSTDTYVINANENVNAEFLYYKILDQIYFINANLFQGSGLKHLQKKNFRKQQLFYPKSVEEQSKIAEVLSRIDKLIEINENLISKFKRIKVGLMQDLISNGIDKKGNIRTEISHKFKDSQLGRIPEEWECTNIGSYKNLLTSGSRGWAKYYNVEGSKFIRITNLKRNQIEIDVSDMEYVNLPLNVEGSRSKLKLGDILISITADLGIIGIVSQNLVDAYVNQHIALVRLDTSEINTRFLAYYLTSTIGQKMFTIYNDGGAKSGLNLTTINNLMFTKPSLEEQKKIVEKLDLIDRNIDKYKSSQDKYKNIKTGLMQDLLTGKVRVIDLKIEETDAA
ncbi:restriction endonuclease subunit S [Halpernia sp.]|uniref:restriction endonuclease subunit S n=1 Tax=Halpernia sp. TaxID=2782209 RepID=UPI003A91036D